MTTIVSSITLREIIATYTQEYVNRAQVEVLVEPLEGETQINPGEECRITLRATNDPDFSNPTGADPAGVRLINVRWHVRTVGSGVCAIIAPSAPLVGRDGPSEDSARLTPGDQVDELYVFPRHGKSVLEPGEAEEIDLRGIALGPTGGFTLAFNVIADVDPEHLGLEDQASFADTGSGQVVT